MSNSQLNKLKSSIKNGTEVTLNLSSDLIRSFNDETNFPHLLSTDTQVSKIRKAFANGLSTNIKFSKTQLSKIIQSGGFLADISGITSALDKIVNFPVKVLESYLKEFNNIDTKNIRTIKIRIIFI